MMREIISQNAGSLYPKPMEEGGRVFGKDRGELAPPCLTG